MKYDLNYIYDEAPETPVYAFEEYRDSRSYGETELFSTADEAIARAKDAWNRLGRYDQESYKKDINAWFRVCYYADGIENDADVLWDALQEG